MIMLLIFAAVFGREFWLFRKGRLTYIPAENCMNRNKK